MSATRRTFAVIETVTAGGRAGLKFTDIVERTGIAKATAHRLLRDLVELSVLQIDPATRHYRGGLMLARLGASVTANYDLRTAVRPFLETLHAETGHVSTLGVHNDGSGIYVDKIEAKNFGIRLHSEIGKAFPLHCTAMGKVLLSHADADTRRRLLSRKLDAYSPNTVTDPKVLRRELERVTEQGYAIDREEITRGLVCVAAPVFGLDGGIAGAMSCTFPSYVLDERGIDAEIAAVCRQAKLASAGSRKHRPPSGG